MSSRSWSRLASLLACAGLLGGCLQMKKAKAVSEAAVIHFHDIYNSGKLEQLWSEADGRLRAATPKDKFLELMQVTQRKLGKVTSSINRNWQVNAFGDKSTARLAQQTTFEHGQGNESFVFEVHGDSALLLGYHIDSPSFEIK